MLPYNGDFLLGLRAQATNQSKCGCAAVAAAAAAAAARCIQKYVTLASACVPRCVCVCVEHCQPSYIEMKSFWPIKRQLRPTWSTRDPKPKPEPKPKPKPQTHFRFVLFAVYSAVHIVVVDVAAAAIFLSVGHFASPKKEAL